jgi:mono/diheme cytochrome c family protein
MINVARISVNLAVSAAVMALVYGCGQPAQDSDQSADESQPVSEPQAQVMERGVQSIDADGNVAPFGMASKQPKELAAPVAAAVQVDAAQKDPGATQYTAVCSACHGSDASGVQGLGLNLVTSSLVASSSQSELVDFLKAGRAANDAGNTTGMAMPAFNWMNEEQLNDVAAFLQSL